MIVLKSIQEMVLAILQSVSDIVERRHAIPFLGRMPLRSDVGEMSLWAGFFQPGLKLLSRTLRNTAILSTRPVPQRRHSLVLDLPPSSYCGSKVNGRNAP